MKILFNVKCVMFNLIVLYALHFTHCTVFAQSVSSEDLINNAALFDSKLVVYEGEAIGEVMLRGDYAWVNLNDGRGGAIGIWMEKNLTAAITHTGSYKTRGDWLEVTGVFHRACGQHGGDLDIHAQTIRKIISGRQFKERLNPAKLNFALVLLGVLCLVLILRLWKSR